LTNTLIKGTQIPSIVAGLRDFLAEWREPTPTFTFQIGWSSTYDLLLREEFDKGLSGPSEIMKEALSSGRVLLAGRAGSAKTTVAYRLLKLLLEKGDIVPVLIDLKSWRAPYYQEWGKGADDFALRLEFLLARLSTPKLNLAVLDGLGPEILRVIVIDGLNAGHYLSCR
jgi:hypothetical protein